MNWIERVVGDRYHVRLRPEGEPDEHGSFYSCEWEVRRRFSDGTYELEEGDRPSFTQLVELSNIIVSGSTKWDGFSEMQWDTECVRVLGLRDAKALGSIFVAIYEMTIEAMPYHQFSISD